MCTGIGPFAKIAERSQLAPDRNDHTLSPFSLACPWRKELPLNVIHGYRQYYRERGWNDDEHINEFTDVICAVGLRGLENEPNSWS